MKIRDKNKIKLSPSFAILAYRQFVKDFTRVAKSFYEMTRNDRKQNWKEKQQRAFKKLKERFTTEPVLIILDLDKEMRADQKQMQLSMRLGKVPRL